MTTKAINKTKIIRGAKRGVSNREQIYHILDNALICHVGFIMPSEASTNSSVNSSNSSSKYPMVIPTCHWREGNTLYWHAHSKAKNIKKTGTQQVCVTVTQLDGLVMARSAFNHSVNYRSVMVFGEAQEITDPAEKVRQFKLMVDKFSPNRWQQLRPVTDTEIKATGLIALDLDQVSCKVRDDIAIDEPEDVDWPVWAGVLPFNRGYGEWQINPDSQGNYALPEYPNVDINGEV